MISANNITVNFGARNLFKNVSFQISGRDRIGLVGSNGAGKSTLLKILINEFQPEEGVVSFSKHTTFGYLPQEGLTYEGKTLYDEVYSSVDDINNIQNEIADIESEMETFTDHSSEQFLDLIENYTELQQKFNDLDGFKLKSKIEKILIGLGFKNDDFNRLTDEFSGGWQMRIAIAKLLLKNPSVILLDEPTNHLDIESLIWFENYLKNYNGAILLISHDKNFLDNITDKTIEISMGKVTLYSGNYSFYVKEKEERKTLLENQKKNQDKYLKQQEKFIERFRYKATKAKAVQSRIKLVEKLDIIELEDEENSIKIKFPPATHSGKISLEIENLYKTYDDKKYILEDINLILERGEKIALVGVNGAGKSTLARMIAGFESISKGKIKLGHLVDIKYYSQHQSDELDPDKTVLEVMEECANGEIAKNLRNILGSFLFRGDDVFKLVKVLSGGEKSRLALAKMLIEPSNFLILDEPTNHLDMRSKDVLMEALNAYEGTVLVVSHDRYFLDGIINKVIEVKDKKIKIYYGNSSDYLKAKDRESSPAKKEIEEKSSLKNSLPVKNTYSAKKEIKKKITPIRKKISELELEMTALEKRLKEIESIMSAQDFFKKTDDIKSITGEYNSLKERISVNYSQWEKETEKLTELETLLT
ncbi:MAG TPA: ABC-F family ATP-binding cassette domain-containing protein [Ignavibacteria bacterium]|nr:ABC-F family ATP-binding cassette domain-containing protein [Ignavibacteria bacterium]